MDIVTHTLSGLALAQAGFRQRLGPAATLAVTVGALAPDLDAVMALSDQLAAIRYHRGLTHSFVGGGILAVLLAWPIWRWWGGSARFRQMAGLVYLGILIHIALDLITAFGTRVFWPFSETRLALDLAFIVDPFVTAAFAVPLVIAWWQPRLAARTIRVGLAAGLLYLGLAAGAKAVAAEGFTGWLRSQGVQVERATLLPHLFSPFRWLAVAEAPGRLYQATVSGWTGTSAGFRLYSQAPRNGYIETSDALESVRLFLAFARFPWIRYLQEGEDHIVEYRDIRFGTEHAPSDMALRVIIDGTGRVKGVDFNHRF